MAEEPKPIISIWLLIVLVIVVLGAGAAAGYFYFKKTKTNPTATTTTPTTNTASQTQTYTNKEFGFSFQYPATWEQQLSQGDTVKDSFFTIELADPVRLKEILTTKCAMGESSGTYAGDATLETCTPILAGMTAVEKEAAVKPLLSRNIHVYVFKSTPKSLDDWLIARYRVKNTESQDFKPGVPVTINNISYTPISIGCCADYNMAYIAQRGEYIYQIGTNYVDGDLNRTYTKNSLLDEVMQTWQFSQ